MGQRWFLLRQRLSRDIGIDYMDHLLPLF